MVLRYSYIRALGGNTHRVELYDSYTREHGLIGNPLEVFERSRAGVLNHLVNKRLTEEQKKALKGLQQEKCDGMIVLEDGRKYQY